MARCSVVVIHHYGVAPQLAPIRYVFPPHICVKESSQVIDGVDPSDFFPRDVDEPGRTRQGARRDRSRDRHRSLALRDRAFQGGLPVAGSRAVRYAPAISLRCFLFSYRTHNPAIPHRLMEDDIYNGYFLPKNAIVLGNAWYVSSVCPTNEMTNGGVRAILHDHRLFPGPLHVQAGALQGPERRPTRSSRSRLCVRLRQARIPRTLDGTLVRPHRCRERAFHFPHREGRARRPRRRAHWRSYTPGILACVAAHHLLE